MVFVILVFVLLLLGTVFGESSNAKVSGTDCVIPIGSKREYLAQWPLIYTPKGELYPTTHDDETGELKVLIDGGNEVILSCGPNYLKQFGRKELLNVYCNRATGNFTVDKSDMSPKELTCDLRVIEEVIDKVAGCETATSRFGFVEPIKGSAFLIGEACYDASAGVTKFVHFKLGHKTASFIEEQPKNYLTSHRHPDGRYKIELFRGLRFDEIYDRIRTTLHTSHIPQLKMAHYVDEPLLASEQFQAEKKLGWNYYVGYDDNEPLETLKRDIKKISETKNLDIYIGSYGVKQLKGVDGSKMELYLHETSKRFPMPALIWFVVKCGDEATAFGIWNDGDSGNSLIESERELVGDGANVVCKNSNCEKISWLSIDLKHNTKLICCDVNEFRQGVRNVPAIGNVKKMLT